jgi:DNA polymerase elongation subunit (family B)
MAFKTYRKINGLTPIRSKKVFEKPIFGFDVETANNNKDFVMATINGNNYLKTFYTRKDLIKELVHNQIFRRSYIIATNLMFDFFASFDRDNAFNVFDILERQGRVLCATSYINYKKPEFHNKQDMQDFVHNVKNYTHQDFYKIMFIDSLNHALLSVDDMGKILKIPKLEKPPFLGKFPKNKKQWDILLKYNIRDTEITKRYMQFLQTSYNELNAKMGITISSTALDCFRRNYLKINWKQEDRAKILFCYNGYYGGRTECFKRGIFSDRQINVYDVNSLYPYVMQKYRYPNVNESYFKEKPSLEAIYHNEGVGEFELRTPQDYIPYLPYRSDKLLFPVGHIKGVYDFFSIRMALKQGYELVSIKKCLIYPKTFTPFKEYVTDLYAKRKGYQENGDTREIVIKYLLNSLYGKFGYNFKEKEIITNFNDMVKFTNTDKYSIFQ